MFRRPLAREDVRATRFERPDAFATPEILALAREELGPTSTLFRALSALPLRLVHETTFGWAGRAHSVQLVTLVRRIDSASFATGCLSVRVHSKTSWSSTAVLRVILQNVAPTPDDPSKPFPGSNVATVNVPSAATAPLLFTAELDDAPLGPWLRLFLRWEQGATDAGAGVRQDVSLSVDLLGRPAWLTEPEDGSNDPWTSDE